MKKKKKTIKSVAKKAAKKPFSKANMMKAMFRGGVK